MKVLVVVGTHEQPFDRLVVAADTLVGLGHSVYVQYGASTPPRFATGESLVERDTLDALMKDADVIITHGGPGSIWQAFAHGKHPIVVPRRRSHGEHVDDHQVAFARRLEVSHRVVVVREVDELPSAVEGHHALIAALVLPEQGVALNRLELKRRLDEWLLGEA